MSDRGQIRLNESIFAPFFFSGDAYFQSIHMHIARKELCLSVVNFLQA